MEPCSGVIHSKDYMEGEMNEVQTQTPEDVVFTEESYQNFLKDKQHIDNERIRPPSMSFWEAMASPDADFTKDENWKDLKSLFQAPMMEGSK
jgi:hypothetical protein